MWQGGSFRGLNYNWFMLNLTMNIVVCIWQQSRQRIKGHRNEHRKTEIPSTSKYQYKQQQKRIPFQKEKTEHEVFLHCSFNKTYLKSDVQPDVCKKRETCCDSEHFYPLDSSRLPFGYTRDANSSDNEQVEGGRPDDGARSEGSRLEPVPCDLDNGEQNLWGAGPQSHEGEVGDGVVPDADFDLFDLTGVIDDLQLLGHTGDDLDGAHEDVGDDGHAHETPEESEQVDEGSEAVVPSRLVGQREDETKGGTHVLSVHNFRAVPVHPEVGGGDPSGEDS